MVKLIAVLGLCVTLAAAGCDRSVPPTSSQGLAAARVSDEPVSVEEATAAWTEAGFAAEWAGERMGFESRFITYETDPKLVVNPLPTFRLKDPARLKAKGGLTARLVVGVPFGVDLGAQTATEEMVRNLARQHNLVWLDLSGATVTDSAVDGLAGLKRLNFLKLPKAAITGRTFGTLADAGLLHALSLATGDVPGRRPVRAEEVVQFGGGHLGNVIGRQVTDDHLKHLAGFTNLKRLNLGITDVGHERAAAAYPNTDHIARLPLGSPRLTDGCLTHLAGFAQLESLNLADAAITDKGVKEIARHANLKYLDLTRTEITDESLKDLAELKLTWLSVRDTRVTLGALQVYRAARPDCKVSD